MFIHKKIFLVITLLLFIGEIFFVSTLASTPRFPFFDDVSVDHQNFGAITRLHSLGSINGYPDGSFKPDIPVSRAEALKILLLGSDIAVPSYVSQNPFSDVPKGEWFAKYVQQGKQKGIVNGRLDEENFTEEEEKKYLFVPADTVNRAEALKMIFLVNEITNIQTPTEDVFVDVKADDWFAPYFLEAKNRNFFPTKKTNNKLYPAGQLTRGELVELMSRYSKSTEKKISLPVFSDWKGEKKFSPLEKNTWDGISLDNNLLPVFRTNEIHILTGSSDSNEVTALVTMEGTAEKFSYTSKVVGNRFSLPIYFPKGGTITIGLIQGTSGSLIVHKGEVFTEQELIQNTNEKNAAPKNFSAAFEEGKVLLSWDDSLSDVFFIEIFQNGQYQQIITNDTKVFLPNGLFTDFIKGNVFITVKGSSSKNGSSLALQTSWSDNASLVIPVYTGFPMHRDESVTSIDFTDQYDGTIRLSATIAGAKDGIEAYVMDGNENLYKKPLQQDGEKISFSFTPKSKDLFLIELADAEGKTLAVLPATPKGLFPVIPLASAKEVNNTDSLSAVQQRIKIFRETNNRPVLTYDDAIAQLAQVRADDMKERNYFAHLTPGGKDVNDFRIDLGVKVPLGENISNSYEGALDATKNLEFSLTHRDLLLNKKFSRYGVGIAKTEDGQSIVVELFAGDAPNEQNITDTEQALNARIAEKFSDLKADITLEQASYNWAQIMAEKKEAKLEFSDGKSWKKILDEYKIKRDISVFIAGYSSLDQVESFLDEKDVVFDGAKNFGFSIAVSEEGIIFITFLVSR